METHVGGAINYATYNSAILSGPLDPKKAEIYTANDYLFAQGVSEVPGLQVQPDRKGLPIWGTQVCWRACHWVGWRVIHAHAFTLWHFTPQHEPYYDKDLFVPTDYSNAVSTKWVLCMGIVVT